MCIGTRITKGFLSFLIKGDPFWDIWKKNCFWVLKIYYLKSDDKYNLKPSNSFIRIILVLKQRSKKESMNAIVTGKHIFVLSFCALQCILKLKKLFDN